MEYLKASLLLESAITKKIGISKEKIIKLIRESAILRKSIREIEAALEYKPRVLRKEINRSRGFYSRKHGIY